MPHYLCVGDVPHKRHTQHRAANGALYYEELVGANGFSAESALLYHRYLPAAITASREWPLPREQVVANHPLRGRHLRTGDLAVPAADAVTGRLALLTNADVTLSWFHATQPSPLYRNAGADECVFVHRGSAVVETAYGVLQATAGMYVVLPRGTTHRWVPDDDEPVGALVIAARGHVAPPSRYLTRGGQFMEHSPYCERDLRAPSEPLYVDDTDVEVYVRHGDTGSIVTHARHPFDLVGWDGCLYPYGLHVDDFEPITGRVHQPPPVHQVFEAPGFVVCNFVPRKVDYHPDAIPAPYYHHNIDSDEVLFYVAGNYAARSGSGIGSGSISLHPAGLTHGPQPGSYERSIGVTEVDELAVMVDTFAPLSLTQAALAIDDEEYPWTWAR
ncbi:MAG TPA: homogentisate 1,2-dioxygenase [Ilumatobacteraceae bacterium]|nr:homogentisate 1,2-dioxygenase [Ilumatobacteraceae bacterium]